MTPRGPGRAGWLAGALLAGAVAAVYAEAPGLGFAEVDDGYYVTANPYVLSGLTAESVRWAWTANVASNWHPVTLWSLMLDVELFGAEPGALHRTNAILHGINTLLFFGALCALTGRRGPAAFAAALYAVHPIHVEPVAWISQRKDLLASAFGLGAVWAYAAFARRPGALRYALVAALFALGLMSKPVMVTLPVLLLALDFWPLRRMGGRALVEKLPLLALSVLSSAVTLGYQEKAIRTAAVFSLGERFANAVVSTVRYLGKLVWPSDLAPFYPHPNLPGGTPWTALEVSLCLALVVGVSAAALRVARSRPYLLFGWLWFGFALAPMLGLVPAGGYAMADRYAYWPFLGLYVAIAWLGADAVSGLRRGSAVRIAALAAAGAVVLALGLVARQQLRIWRDPGTLFEAAVAASPRSPFALGGLANARGRAGRVEEAESLYRRALAIDPGDFTANVNLGTVVATRGDLDGGIHHLRVAVASATRNAEARLILGKLLHARGDVDEAAALYLAAVERDPALVEAHQLRAGLLRAQGRDAEARRHLEIALAEMVRRTAGGRGGAEAERRRATLLLDLGRAPEALSWARRAVERSGGRDAAALDTLAHAQRESGDEGEALATARAALARAEATGDATLAAFVRARLARWTSGERGGPRAGDPSGRAPAPPPSPAASP